MPLLKMAKIGLLTMLYSSVIVHAVALSLYDPNADRELARYNEEAKILHDKLISEGCDDPEVEKTKRSLLQTSADSLKLEVKKELYEKLINMLVECRHTKLKISTAKIQPGSSEKLPLTTASTLTAPDSDNSTVVNPITQPDECLSAINLTEPWRRDHNGSNMQPTNGVWNCDTKYMITTGRPWFRFAKAAGSHLSHECVPRYQSCGTHTPMWSDDPMPSSIGVATSFKIYAFHRRNCKFASQAATVIRCSDAPHDFVYRYDGKESCHLGFCGSQA